MSNFVDICENTATEEALYDNRYNELQIFGSKRYNTNDNLTDNFEPQWLNKEKIKRAKAFVKKHFFSIYFAHFSGLVLLVHVKSILIPLLSTGNSKTIAHLFNRYFRTLQQIKLWYEKDVWDRNDEAFKSIMKVRKMHALVSKKLNQEKIMDSDSMCLSQLDMIITQFAFIGFIVLYPKQMGMSCDSQDMDALLHFWRGIGYLLGIEERFNLCNGSVDQIKQMCRSLLEQQLKKSIIVSPPEEGVEMSRGIVNAIRSFIYLLTWESHAKYLFQVIDVPKQITLGLYSSIIYNVMRITFNYLLHFTIFAFLFNNLLRFSLMLTNLRRHSIEKSLTKKYDIVFAEILGDSKLSQKSNEITDA